MTQIDCTDDAHACTPEMAPQHVVLMGASFGREDDTQSRGTHETNLFLDVASDGFGPSHHG